LDGDDGLLDGGQRAFGGKQPLDRQVFQQFGLEQLRLPSGWRKSWSL
jgi:hypothetical protein